VFDNAGVYFCFCKKSRRGWKNAVCVSVASIYIGEIFHELANHQESKIEEGHLMGDHIHMCISIPPKYPVSKVVGYIKGKSVIMIARKIGKKVRNYKGESFRARGYFFSTVGLDEEMVREYIRNQYERDKYFDQQNLPL